MTIQNDNWCRVMRDLREKIIKQLFYRIIQEAPHQICLTGTAYIYGGKIIPTEQMYKEAKDENSF